MDTQRAIDWIQGGYGVEDVALIMDVPLREVRSLVAQYRADGTLRIRLLIRPGHGTFLHCRRGHRQDAATLGLKPNGWRFCRICQSQARKRSDRHAKVQASYDGWN